MMEMKLAINYVRSPPRGKRCRVCIFGSKIGRESHEVIITEPRRISGMSITNGARGNALCVEGGCHILSSYLMGEDGQRGQTDEPEQNAKTRSKSA
jgi:hypothetical protein